FGVPRFRQAGGAPTPRHHVLHEGAPTTTLPARARRHRRAVGRARMLRRARRAGWPVRFPSSLPWCLIAQCPREGAAPREGAPRARRRIPAATGEPTARISTLG